MTTTHRIARRLRAALTGCAAAAVLLAAQAADYRNGDKLASPPGASSAPAAVAGGYKLTEWSALVPAGWDPMQDLKNLDFGRMQDGDPRTTAALERMKKAWDTAPAVQAMDDARIRIAGFAVPLEGDKAGVREFLLVPYFGACVHTPPPPANQIIHVKLGAPTKEARMMDPVWVSGRLHVAISDSAMGTATYRMDGTLVAPYRGR